MRMLEKIIKENEQFVTDDGETPRFICHPEGVVHISVPAEKWHLLRQRQYKIAEALLHLTDECIRRWYKAGKIKDAPAGCIFNNPLLVAPKYDKSGEVCGIRICLDARELNKYMTNDDKFELPKVSDVLQTFANGKFFGEFDLKEAYTQFQVAADSQKYRVHLEGEAVCVRRLSVRAATHPLSIPALHGEPVQRHALCVPLHRQSAVRLRDVGGALRARATYYRATEQCWHQNQAKQHQPVSQ